MDFSYSENQKMISDMIQQFGKQNISPFVREWDDNQAFPVKIFKKFIKNMQNRYCKDFKEKIC